jgi:hypothetical protein
LIKIDERRVEVIVEFRRQGDTWQQESGLRGGACQLDSTFPKLKRWRFEESDLLAFYALVVSFYAFNKG